MDIFNRPPAISEETLHYVLYPPNDLPTDKSYLTSLAACIQSHVQAILPEYFLWHRDPLEFKVASDVQGVGILEGRMRVGDCIDDEWYAVWLLGTISEKWDLVISVSDSDGQFLLIEAAETLPSWVNPTNAKNRVWIYRSQLHLVPISHVSAISSESRHQTGGEGEEEDEIEDGFLSVEDAVKLVRDENVDTRAPQAVEKAVWDRISKYPAVARDHVHFTKAYLPVDIALAVSANPHLIQKPIETFYTRDAIQLRAAHRMSRFPPEPSTLTTVKMTRTAYAQLVGQKFYPPKIFGRWNELEGSREWRWRDVGMKIACGFEMLYQESKGRGSTLATSAETIQSSKSALKEALRRDPEYTKYIQTLTSLGYFKSELEGSKLWNELEDKAASVYADARREDDASRSSFAVQVAAAIALAKDSPASLSQDLEEDADSWLDIDAQDFDQMLEQRVGSKRKDAADVHEDEGDAIAKEQAKKLAGLAKKVEAFVEGDAGLGGARFEDEESSGEESGGENMFDSDDGDQDEDSDDDMDQTQDAAARQAAMDKLVSGLDPSEYGHMPASFHRNSQRAAPPAEDDQPPPTGAPKPRPIRRPILPRDKYDGVDSDDETDSEEERQNELDDEDGDERPQVVGEIEVDMGLEEEEFLEFSRDVLGIDKEQWEEIVRDRRGRGAFIPKDVFLDKKPPTERLNEPLKPAHVAREPVPGPRPNVNPNLDSFEAVMEAMDAELARSRTSATKHRTKRKGKGKAQADDDEGDIEAAMDAELKAALERGDDADDDEGEEAMDYGLIKNFLESFKSQGGLAGPVGNLAGRLQPGWTLPRDES